MRENLCSVHIFAVGFDHVRRRRLGTPAVLGVYPTSASTTLQILEDGFRVSRWCAASSALAVFEEEAGPALNRYVHHIPQSIVSVFGQY